MPSDDVILNLKQIAGYPSSAVQSSDQVVVQRGGLGGPYMSMDAAAFVSGALLDGSTPLEIGVALPADASGSQLSTFSIASMMSALWYWNGYFSSQTNHGKRLGPGPSAALEVNAGTGFSFYWSQPGNAGDQLQNTWATLLNVDPTGYVTVGDQVLLSRDPVNSMEAATASYTMGKIAAAVQPLWTLYQCSTVWSVNGRTGQVIIGLNDVLGAGGAPIFSPHFQGVPTAPFPSTNDNSNQIATTQWVWQALSQAGVESFNGRTGNIVLTSTDINAAGGLTNPSPVLSGVPTSVTPPPLDNSAAIATTAFVQNALTNIDLSNYAPLNSPSFTGYATAPTAPAGTNDGQIATTAFVHAAVVAATTGVSSFNTRTGAVVLSAADITSAGGALLASPVLTGTPQAPTAAVGDHSQAIATTAFVAAALAGGGVVTSFNTRTGAITLQLADVTGAGGAPINSPALTGTPTAPTPQSTDNSTAIATTAFIHNAIAAQGGVVNTFNGRSGAVSLQANDISAAGGAVLASPSFSGVPTAPTATAGTNTSQIATTAFVSAAIAAGQGVSSFNGRTGAITLQTTDVTGAGGAPLANPTFTGVPSGPTATAGTSNTQLATTAFVAAALTTSAVSSFNTRQGAVTLTTADVTGAGGLANPSANLTGTPTAPTAASNTNTTQIATTAFVQAALSSIGAGVVSFNTRTGAVTLIQNDISAAGGAVLASPAFTGSPTAPTAAPGTTTTQLATCAFVAAAITAAPYLPLAGGTVTEQIVSNIPGAGGSANPRIGFVVNSPLNTGKIFQGSAAGNARWQLILGNSATESGTQTGCDFSLDRFDSSGNWLSTALSIARQDGSMYVNSGGVDSNGYIQIGPCAVNVGVQIRLQINSSGGSASRWITSSNGPFLRWHVNWGNGAPETGGNSGSDWNLGRYSDSGAQLDNPIYCYRNSGVVQFSQPITNGSDLRLKRDVAPIEGALAIVEKLKGVYFRMKADPDRRCVGLIAQDVREVLPEVVYDNPIGPDCGQTKRIVGGDRMLSLAYPNLVAVLVEAVKTLSEKVKALEAAA